MVSLIYLIFQERQWEILCTWKSNILKQLSQDSKDLIATEISNINSYIDEKIEVVLAEIKSQIK